MQKNQQLIPTCDQGIFRFIAFSEAWQMWNRVFLGNLLTKEKLNSQMQKMHTTSKKAPSKDFLVGLSQIKRTIQRFSMVLLWQANFAEPYGIHLLTPQVSDDYSAYHRRKTEEEVCCKG